MQLRNAPGAPDTPALAGGGRPASLFDRLRNRDHTRGNLVVSLLFLSGPSLLTMVAGGALFQLVELRFLGELGSDAIAAAGSTNQTLRQLLFLAVMGLSTASQMMIARLIGESAIAKAEEVVGQTFVLGVAVSLFAATLGIFFAEPLVSVFAEPALVPTAALYLRIAFATLFAMVLTQLGSSVLTAAGDTTTPMFITLMNTPLSIAAQYALTFGALGAPALGIAGIPLGAALGGTIGLAVQFWALATGRCRVRLHVHTLRPAAPLLKHILAVAWQPALHMVARTAIVMYFMWLAGQLGRDVQAAYTVGLRLEMPAFMIAFTVANACATLVGQNLGAGRLDRSWRSIWVAYGAEIALLWPTAIAMFFFRESIVSAFTSDPPVAAMASEFLKYSACVMGFYGLYFVSFRALQASGDMRTPMIISIGCAFGIGAPLGWYLATQTDLHATGMWIANAVYAGANATLTVGYLLSGRWARRHVSLRTPD